MSEIFITSDTHFNHAKCIDFCNRPYDSLAEMNESLIAKWNEVVGNRDQVWHLGDFGFTVRREHEKDTQLTLSHIFHRLNGSKNLLVGNHDEQNKEVLGMFWNSVQYYSKFKWNRNHIVLSHYPFEAWQDQGKGAHHFHGHSHNNLPRMSRRFDVGVDNPIMNYAPLPMETLVEMSLKEEPYARDHHK